jgi:hypothetical protein
MKGFRRMQRGRPLRPMDWVGSGFGCGQYSTVNPCDAQAVYAIPPSQVRDTFTDPTLMTSLISLNVQTTTPATTGNRPGQFLFGLITMIDVNDIVPADFPDPFTNIESDWVGIGVLPLQTQTNVTTWTGTTSERGDGMVQWNSRRRLGNDHGLLLVVFNDSFTSVDWKFVYRGLIKE